MVGVVAGGVVGLFGLDLVDADPFFGTSVCLGAGEPVPKASRLGPGDALLAEILARRAGAVDRQGRQRHQ